MGKREQRLVVQRPAKRISSLLMSLSWLRCRRHAFFAVAAVDEVPPAGASPLLANEVGDAGEGAGAKSDGGRSVGGCQEGGSCPALAVFGKSPLSKGAYKAFRVRILDRLKM